MQDFLHCQGMFPAGVWEGEELRGCKLLGLAARRQGGTGLI